MEATATESDVIHHGSCKWFNSTKGFGFITPDDGSADVFVHQTSIQADGFRSLAEGERVEYTIEVDKRTGRVKAKTVTGPAGVNVKGAPRKPKHHYRSKYEVPYGDLNYAYGGAYSAQYYPGMAYENQMQFGYSMPYNPQQFPGVPYQQGKYYQ